MVYLQAQIQFNMESSGSTEVDIFPKYLILIFRFVSPVKLYQD